MNACPPLACLHSFSEGATDVVALVICRPHGPGAPQTVEAVAASTGACFHRLTPRLAHTA